MPNDFWFVLFVLAVVFAAFFWLFAPIRNKLHGGEYNIADGSSGDSHVGGHSSGHGSDCGHGGDCGGDGGGGH